MSENDFPFQPKPEMTQKDKEYAKKILRGDLDKEIMSLGDSKDKPPESLFTKKLLEGNWDTVTETVYILISNRSEDWKKLEAGTLNPSDWVVGEEDALVWNDVINSVRFINAVVEEKYPFIKRFSEDPGSDIYKIAKRLESFVDIPDTILAFHETMYPEDKPWE